MDSAAWMFRRTNRLATVKWGATQKIMEDTIRRVREEGPARDAAGREDLPGDAGQQDARQAALHGRAQYLTKYTNDFAHAAMSKSIELGDQFMFLLRGGL